MVGYRTATEAADGDLSRAIDLDPARAVARGDEPDPSGQDLGPLRVRATPAPAPRRLEHDPRVEGGHETLRGPVMAAVVRQFHDVGRGRVNEYLRPDDRTLAPRLHFHARCQTAIAQMKRYTWDDFKHGQGKDLKQKPRDKYDDFPTLLKYLMNYLPTFSVLKEGAAVIRRPGTRIGAY